MGTTTTETKQLRGLLTKKPFVRTNPESRERVSIPSVDISERKPTYDKIYYDEVTQADFLREYYISSHAINDRNIYKNYRQSDEDGLYYEEDFPRYAFPFQSEITDDRLGRLTINDIQFDLADKTDDDKAWDTYNAHRAGWADKRMENAWHKLVKSVLITGDGAIVGILHNGKFKWTDLSFLKGDTLFPHYDRRSGEMSVFARTYRDTDDNGNDRDYVDVWDTTYYYRFANDNGNTDDKEDGKHVIGDYELDGYILEEKTPHGFNEVPVAYHRDDSGACWSGVQELCDHYESAFSRLAQSNHDFGLPILGLYGDGKKIKEIATADMSYASKVFIIPSDGKAEFLNRQDASNAYKTELDELKKKIYEGSMVIKAPELKSGDTPAAAIELLYSDAYNKAALEAQEYDPFLCKLKALFEYGYGVESNRRLEFMNTRITFWIQPHLPINTQEITTNLATAVQNGFVSKQTASEKFYFATAQEWRRILKEKHDEQAQELLVEEQRLENQNDANVDMQKDLSEIQTQQQIDIIKAESKATDDDKEAPKVRSRQGRVNTGRGRGRPRTVNTDKWGNRANENNWDKWNSGQ